jgi:hypothetical protein
LLLLYLKNASPNATGTAKTKANKVETKTMITEFCKAPKYPVIEAFFIVVSVGWKNIFGGRLNASFSFLNALRTIKVIGLIKISVKRYMDKVLNDDLKIFISSLHF